MVEYYRLSDKFQAINHMNGLIVNRESAIGPIQDKFILLPSKKSVFSSPASSFSGKARGPSAAAANLLGVAN
jgi:hypothetical protein